MLTLEDVTRGYRRQPVLSGVSVTLAPRSVTSLTGGNGTGKTTLLRVAAGMLEPERGAVSIAGLDPVRDRRAYQRLLGYVPAGNGGLYARLTVLQQLELWADLALVPRAWRSRRVGVMLTLLALSELRDRRVDRLSTGQRQRVRLATGFLHEPHVVLLDEPHASLDDAGMASLTAAIGDVTERGGAVLWCAPKRDGVSLPSARDLVLAEGRVTG